MGMSLIAKHTTTAAEAAFDFEDIPEGYNSLFLISNFTQALADLGWNDLTGVYQYSAYYSISTSEYASSGNATPGLDQGYTYANNNQPQGTITQIINAGGSNFEKVAMVNNGNRNYSWTAQAHYASSTAAVTKLNITLSASIDAGCNFYLYGSF